MKEVIESDLEQSGDRCIRCDVAANTVIEFVLAGYHRHRVPARQSFDPALESAVAWKRNFFVRWNRVDVRSVVLDGQFNSDASGTLRQLFQQIGGAVRPYLVNHLIERLQPLRRLLRIQVYSLS